ncbi:MAG: hypothetical protein PHD58_00275 [Anaerolineales bacterium]|nr:hypothetical protein [Anaerolineales bacterium]
MERTVPRTASEEVELYLRTYYSLLRSTAEVNIRTLEEVHAGMSSLLHPGARSSQPDIAAFLYCLLRLPACMPQVRLVVLGQSRKVIEQAGFGRGRTWQPVFAPARRRRCFFDGVDTLACVIASRSDIDDVIPMLTAYQIEWNKLHDLLRHLPPELYASDALGDQDGRQRLAGALKISSEDLERLHTVWGDQLPIHLQRIAAAPRRLAVRLVSGSLRDYRRATNAWWENIERACPELRERPVFFISSNIHSLANLLSGFALRNREQILRFTHQPANAALHREWEEIQKGQVPSSEENFLYYALRKWQQAPDGGAESERQQAEEQAAGILRIPSENYFDVEAQVIRLSSLQPQAFDPRVLQGDLAQTAATLSRSDALLLNIDYPLGMAAYHILSVVGEHVGALLGVYMMGKAATLNGVVGDVMISNVVHDEHSQNTYLFPNSLTAADVLPFLVYGSVLDNQKIVSVQGTFLQTARYMEVFYREGYTDIEMEAGPYLSAVYEMYRPKRHPMNEIINLYGLPFDLGMVHYASDTPLSKGKNLGAGSLSYFGMDSTYASALAILRRIFSLECARLAE